MALKLLLGLILFPMAFALVTCCIKRAAHLAWVAVPGALALIAGAILLLRIPKGDFPLYFTLHAPWIESAILILEMAMALWLMVLALRAKQVWALILIVLQTGLILTYTFGLPHPEPAEPPAALFFDQFSLLMGLVIGVIGGLITLYAIGYMKDYHHHHPEVKNRQSAFFAIIFLFFSAMFGICFANNLLWMFFFWEITTLCSFLLIRYRGNEESIKNAFTALRWNMLGGIAFIVGIGWLEHAHHTLALNELLTLPQSSLLFGVALIALAGMTKSAQLPFSNWLTGAMVAPTPVSALLHSSTMVKAGVYLVLRFASALQNSMVGMLVATVGAVTFVVASFICVSQNDAKKILAYSTIANLGLIILCAGVGTGEAVWAAMLLILFHAVSKGLLFLTVGVIEHHLGSRAVEDMTALTVRMPKTAIMLLIGIAGMFLAPFGMLISKWAVLKALVDYSPIFALLLVYGSAATLFFWVKWMGKILIVLHNATEEIEEKFSKGQMAALFGLTLMTILLCGGFAAVAHQFIDPYVMANFGEKIDLRAGNLIIIAIMLTLVCLFPLSFLFYGRKIKVVDPYLGGANVASGSQFRNALGEAKAMEMHNYYLNSLFPEKKWLRAGVLIAWLLLAAQITVGVIPWR